MFRCCLATIRSDKEQRTKMSMRMLQLLAVTCSLLSCCCAEILDYCVVGAGPSGIQMAQLLHKADRHYVVFERSNTSGNFYVDYPRHGNLISINKRHTGQTNDEFNLRHDWNSLLSDDLDLRMTKYSKEFFPHRSLFVKYMNDFTRKLELKVQYDTNIVMINPPPEGEENGEFVLTDQKDGTYKCRTLVMATGIAVENIVNFKGSEHTTPYSKVSVDPEDFEGKSVLIIGRGNSAFEVADSILGSTNVVHMMARTRLKLSWETHYVGDLRAVNNGLLDTYQLKSLDGSLEADVHDKIFLKKGDKLMIVPDSNETAVDNAALRDGYDEIITCLGFKYDFSIFNETDRQPKPHAEFPKYPAIAHNYESEQVPGMFFAGTSTHSLDYRKSAGGFIHGFRYSTRSLHHLLEWRNHKVQWPAITAPWSHLMNTVIKRINEASGSYQMFQVLCDVIVLDDATREFSYLNEVPLNLIPTLERHVGYKPTRLIVMVFEYGKDYSGAGKDIFREDRAAVEAAWAHHSNFLHPVFYYYRTLPTEVEMMAKGPKDTLPRPDRIHHMVEDFITGWDAQFTHLLPFRRFLETSIGTDLRSFTVEECYESGMLYSDMPVECEQRYLSGQGLQWPEKLVPEEIKFDPLHQKDVPYDNLL